MFLKNNSKIIFNLFIFCLFNVSSVKIASADVVAEAAQATEPYSYLIKFSITGNYTGVTDYGSPVFTVGGPGYTPVITSSAQVLSNKVDGLLVATLSNAQITFVMPHQGDPAYVSRFTCLGSNGGCHIAFKDGSVLVADPNVSLDGRLVGGIDPSTGLPSPWGFVANDKYDPANGIFPQRILGCGGLKGIAGPLKGTVGSICFNGVFNVPVAASGIDLERPLTGGSNCTITLHHPSYPAVPQ